MEKKLLALMLAVSIFAQVGSVEAQWVRQNSGTEATLTDVVMLDFVTAYAVSKGRSILRTTDAGATWFDLTAVLSCVMPWNAVAFFDSGNGIAVGDYGGVFMIASGGRPWGCRHIPGWQNCHSVLHVTPGNIYVGADSGWIYHSLDSGWTWSSEKISEWPIRSLFAWRGPYVMGLPIYALTSNSICSKTEFPSSSWSEEVLPELQGLGSEAHDGEFSNGGGPGFIVGVGGDLWASPLILRKAISDTAWRGVSATGGGPLFGVSAPSASVIYACGSDGLVVKSTDGGDSWKACPLAYGQSNLPNLNAIYFIDEKHGFAVGDSGSVFYTSNGGVTGIHQEEPGILDDFVLEQNYPNPFNPATTICYRLSALSHVTIKIYDALGKKVVTLLDGEKQSAGNHVIRWNGTNQRQKRVSSGIYYCQLSTESGTQTKKAVVIK